MQVVIIHADGCPLCDRAVAKYRAMGVEPMLCCDLTELDWNLRDDLMVELQMNDIDYANMPLPGVFESRPEVRATTCMPWRMAKAGAR